MMFIIKYMTLIDAEKLLLFFSLCWVNNTALAFVQVIIYGLIQV